MKQSFSFNHSSIQFNFASFRVADSGTPFIQLFILYIEFKYPERTNMDDEYYTFNLWKIKDGNLEEFLRIWEKELAHEFIKLNPYSKITLIQSLDNPNIFYSFGPWIKLSQMQAARSNEKYRLAISKLVSLCDISKSGSFKNKLSVSDEI